MLGFNKIKKKVSFDETSIKTEKELFQIINNNLSEIEEKNNSPEYNEILAKIVLMTQKEIDNQKKYKKRKFIESNIIKNKKRKFDTLKFVVDIFDSKYNVLKDCNSMYVLKNKILSYSDVSYVYIEDNKIICADSGYPNLIGTFYYFQE